MSLPIGYDNPSRYFCDVLKFLRQYSWIYKTANTNIVKENVFEYFLDEWLNYFLSISNNNLNLFPQNLNEDTLPTTLREFQKEIITLKPILRNNFKENLNENNISLRKVNLKKIHEISIFSKVILDICNDEIDILIDFGCGLGYLEEILHKVNKNINIIGLESDPKRVLTAIKRLNDYYVTAKEKIYFLQHNINSENTSTFIIDNIKKLYPYFEIPKIAIIGLHSCADLTNISMEIFLNNLQVKKLIIMPCCYHKLEVLTSKNNTENCIYFKNFPLSNSLNELTKQFKYGEILNRPFLRLACQQTVSRWKEMNEIDHLNHGQEMFCRALLETVRNENEIICKKNKNQMQDIIKLDIEKIKLYYEFKSKSTNNIIQWTKEKEIKIEKLLLKYHNGWKLAESLTCLQTSIQEICENLVLFDRICFIEENSFTRGISIDCKFEKIFNDKLSPRCFTLIAEKIDK